MVVPVVTVAPVQVQAATPSPKVVAPSTAGKVQAVLADAGLTFAKIVVPVVGLALLNHTAGQKISLSGTYQASFAGVVAAFSVLWHGVPAALSAKQAAAATADEANFIALVAKVKAAEAAQAATPPAV